MKNPFKVGDIVKLRPDADKRATGGDRTAQLWRETLKHLADKKGKVTRSSPDNNHVNVEYEQSWESRDQHNHPYVVNTIGINFKELVPFTQDPSMGEGVGYVYDKDMKKDPKHIKGKRWTVKFENEKSPLTESEIRNVIQELIKELQIKNVTETRETPDKNYIIFGKSGPITTYFVDSPTQGERMVQFGESMAFRFTTLEQVRNEIIKLKKKYKGITNWDYKIVQNLSPNVDRSVSQYPIGDNQSMVTSPNRKGHTVSRPVKKGEEYFVRYAIDGKTDEGKSYYTNDKQDALDTYAYMLKLAEEQNKKHT